MSVPALHEGLVSCSVQLVQGQVSVLYAQQAGLPAIVTGMQHVAQGYVRIMVAIAQSTQIAASMPLQRFAHNAEIDDLDNYVIVAGPVAGFAGSRAPSPVCSISTGRATTPRCISSIASCALTVLNGDSTWLTV